MYYPLIFRDFFHLFLMFSLMLGLHYVPGSHGSHGSQKRSSPWCFSHFWKRCFLKTSVSNGIIYTKYTQNPHTIEPPFNIATQSATYTVTACVSRWEPNGLNANNPCPAARQKQYWYFISLLRFSALKCKPNGQKNVVVLENLIIESLHMIETEL